MIVAFAGQTIQSRKIRPYIQIFVDIASPESEADGLPRNKIQPIGLSGRFTRLTGANENLSPVMLALNHGFWLPGVPQPSACGPETRTPNDARPPSPPRQ